MRKLIFTVALAAGALATAPASAHNDPPGPHDDLADPGFYAARIQAKIGSTYLVGRFRFFR